MLRNLFDDLKEQLSKTPVRFRPAPPKNYRNMNNNKKLILSTIAISGWVLAAYIIVNYYLQFVDGAVIEFD